MGVKLKIAILSLALYAPSLSVQSQKKLDVFEVVALTNRAMVHIKEQKYVESLKELKQLLPYNPYRAGFLLGEQYYYGQGTEKNVSEALWYYKISGEEGHPISQQTLGVYYDKNISQNPDLAYYWNRKASLNPDGVDCHDAGPCMYNLGTYYLKGIGISQNELLAELWISLAALLEYAAAEDHIEETYNIIGDRNTEEEEIQYHKELFKHFYTLIRPYLSENSIESLSVKSYYYLLEGDLSSYVNAAKKLYNMPNLSKEGKKLIGEGLINYYRGYKYDKYNAEIIENEINNLGKIDEDLYDIWFTQQFVMAVGELDEKIVKSQKGY